MIEYTKLFNLLKDRDMKRTDLLKIISSPTLAKLGKNEIVKTDIIDKICIFLEVQPNDIMEVYEIEELNGEKIKIKRRSPDTIFFGENQYISPIISELNKYIINENGKDVLDLKRIKRECEEINQKSTHNIE